MKLVFTPNPYVHKEIVVAHESGLLGRMEFERQSPFEPDSNIWKYNPVGKITALETDENLTIFGGLLVCEYLDSFNIRASLFPKDARRWSALQIMNLGDALFNANAALRVELWFGAESRRVDYMLRERRKIFSALDALETQFDVWANRPFDIGQVCVAGALSYIDLRNTVAQLSLKEGDCSFEWRSEHPKIARWRDMIFQRQSVAFRVADLKKSEKAKVQLAAQNDSEWEINGTTIGPGVFP